MQAASMATRKVKRNMLAELAVESWCRSQVRLGVGAFEAKHVQFI